MNRLQTLARMAAAYAAAALMGGMVLTMGLLIGAPPLSANGGVFAFLGSALFMSLVAAWLGAIPAAIVIAIPSRRHIRTPWYFAVSGAAVAVLPGVMIGGMPEIQEWRIHALALIAGILSGLIYWVIAVWKRN